MKAQILLIQLLALAVAGAAVPKIARTFADTRISCYLREISWQLNFPGTPVDADEAVVYPASVDQSWVDAAKRSSPDADDAVVHPTSELEDKRSPSDADEAVVYPASVDQSWVDAKRSPVDADEAVVYPASVDQSWVDAGK